MFIGRVQNNIQRSFRSAILIDPSCRCLWPMNIALLTGVQRFDCLCAPYKHVTPNGVKPSWIFNGLQKHDRGD